MSILGELPLPNGAKAQDPAVVVLSGGQDSVTCLGLALARHENVKAVSFYYGQRHNVELQQAAKICDERFIMHSVLDVSVLATVSTSALLDTTSDVAAPHELKPGLPASFVPARNALFLTLAHACAQEVGAKTIYTGVCETDFSGYPDCRADFIVALEAALNIGYQTDIRIVTPLMYLNKAQTFELASEVGFLNTVIEDSHTCYNGDRTRRHEWGYGCGKCPACDLREKGFREFVANRAEQHGHKTYAEQIRAGTLPVPEARIFDKMADTEFIGYNEAEKGSLLRPATKAPETGDFDAGRSKPKGFA